VQQLSNGTHPAYRRPFDAAQRWLSRNGAMMAPTTSRPRGSGAARPHRPASHPPLASLAALPLLLLLLATTGPFAADAQLAAPAQAPGAAPTGRALRSSTFRLNVSAFYGSGGALMGCLGGVQEVLAGIRGCSGCVVCQPPLRLS